MKSIKLIIELFGLWLKLLYFRIIYPRDFEIAGKTFTLYKKLCAGEIDNNEFMQMMKGGK